MANADITVLVADMQSGAGVVKRLSEYNIRAIDTFGPDHRRRKMGFYMGDARIKATTLHSFKGWEARLLVVYITQAVHAESLALIYTGLTRLKRSQQGSWLTVVSSASELEEYGETWDAHIAKIPIQKTASYKNRQRPLNPDDRHEPRDPVTVRIQ